MLGVRRAKGGARQLLELCAWAEINFAHPELAMFLSAPALAPKAIVAV
jgi:hypothetical protein